MTTRVLATVRHHAAALREAVATEIAGVRSLAGVGEDVHSESRRSREGFCAQLALVGPFASVPATVQRQRVIRRELLAALSA